MKAGLTCATAILGALLFNLAPAFADTLVITYSSGKVQNIALDERLEEVKDIELHKSVLSMPEKVKKIPMGKQRAAEEGPQTAPSPVTKKPAVKWAPPIDE